MALKKICILSDGSVHFSLSKKFSAIKSKAKFLIDDLVYVGQLKKSRKKLRAASDLKKYKRKYVSLKNFGV